MYGFQLLHFHIFLLDFVIVWRFGLIVLKSSCHNALALSSVISFFTKENIHAFKQSLLRCSF